MKRVILLALLFVGIATQAQEFAGELKWGNLIESGKRTPIPEVIGQDDDHVYLVRMSRKAKLIQKYDLRTFKLLKSAEFELKYQDKELMKRGQFMLGGKPCLLTSFYNKKTKSDYTFVQSFNPQTLALSKPTAIGKYTKPPKELREYLTGIATVGTREMIISEDQSIGLVISPEVDFSKVSVQQMQRSDYGFKFTMYNSDLEKQSESVLRLPFDNFTMSSVNIEADGLVYIHGYQEVNEDEDNDYLLVYDVESGDLHQMPIDAGEEYISAWSYEIFEDGSVFVSGLFGESGVEGVFYQKFDDGFEETGRSVDRFDEAFIRETWTAKQEKKFDKKNEKNKKKGKEEEDVGLKDFYLNYVLQREDGSILVLAEQYYMRVVTTTSTGANGQMRTTTTYYYYYKDILAVSYSASGELEWKKWIDKYQKSVNDGGFYSSYIAVQNGNDCHILYGDRQRNHVEGWDEMSKDERRAKDGWSGILVNVGRDGEISEEVMFTFLEDGVRLVPKYSHLVSDKLTLLYARGKRGDKLGKIEF